MNPEKLAKMAAQVRPGGKGSVRRKKKAIHKTTTTDDKRLQNTLKRLGVNNIPAIEEVNLFKDNGTVIHFNNPKGTRVRLLVLRYPPLARAVRMGALCVVMHRLEDAARGGCGGGTASTALLGRPRPLAAGAACTAVGRALLVCTPLRSATN